MFSKKRVVFLSLFLSLSFLLSASLLFAEEEIRYDPYAPILKHAEAVQSEAAESRDRNQTLARILEQPIRPIGFGIGKSAEWVERKHMDEKAIWFFDELATHGIHPSITGPTEGSFGTIGPKMRIELEKLLQWDQPYLISDVSGSWTPNKDFDGTTVLLNAHYKIEPPSSAIFQEGIFKYARSSSESFYGTGQDTSLGEHSTYKPEEVWLEGSFGFHVTQTTDAALSFAYQRMNIGNGARERVGKIKEHFGRTSIQGLNGGDLIGLIAGFVHDSRDHKTDPRRGGEEKVQFSYFHDVDGQDFQYLKLAGSVSHFIPIFSDRRILALRVAGEKLQEIGGDEIPFFNLARLGGSDRADGSELLRSYRYNRFFDEGLLLANVEYRYNIYEYGDFGADAFGLFDIGEVFSEFHDLGFDEIKFSWGGGINLKFRRRTVLSLFLARGSEGWQTAAHTKVSF